MLRFKPYIKSFFVFFWSNCWIYTHTYLLLEHIYILEQELLYYCVIKHDKIFDI